MADISDKAKKPSNSKSEPLDVGAPTSMDSRSFICGKGSSYIFILLCTINYQIVTNWNLYQK